jgi:beta-lactamase class A
VHSIDPATPGPLGSAFKLYVLGALGNAVASGKARWNQPLVITARLKRLPSGVLQAEPDGTAVSVQDTAAKMISFNDNTATDMLINLVGRPAVEAALTRAPRGSMARRPSATSPTARRLRLCGSTISRRSRFITPATPRS